MNAEARKAWTVVALAFLPVSLMMWPVGFSVFWLLFLLIVLFKPNLPTDRS